jgi:stearoyl-CoA desaturase (Delta-9 desaturase)
MLNIFVHGIFELSILGYIGVILATTHITILATTIYLHRAQAHRALTLHPCVSHFFGYGSLLGKSQKNG